MKVLIAKANQDILKDILSVCVSNVKKIKFTESTKNTCTFNVKNESEFIDLYNEIKRRGYNPYALMHW